MKIFIIEHYDEEYDSWYIYMVTGDEILAKEYNNRTNYYSTEWEVQ